MGHLLKIKFLDSRVYVHILASTSVPFTPTTVQVPNIALTHTKRITVYIKVFLLEMFSWLACELLILFTNRSEIDHLKVCVGSEKTYSHRLKMSHS